MYANVDIREVASYLPGDSTFSLLVKQIYNIDDLSNFSSGIVTGTALPTVETSMVFSLPKIEIDIPKIEGEPEDSKENPIKKLVLSDGMPEALSEIAKFTKNGNLSDKKVINNFNIKIRIIQKKVPSKWAKEFFIAVAASLLSGWILIQPPPVEPQIVKTNESTLYRVETTSGNLNIRSAAEMTDNVIRSIPNGDLVRIVEQGEEFYEIYCEDIGVESDQMRCFAHKGYLKKVLRKNQQSKS